MAKLYITNGNGEVIEKEYPEGTTYRQVAEEFQPEFDKQIALVTEDKKIRELFRKVRDEADIAFVLMDSAIGHKVYVRTATFLFMKAARDVLPMEKVKKLKVEFCIGCGYYINVEGKINIDEEMAKKIEKRMRDLSDADHPITKKSLPTAEAVRIFALHGMTDKVKLFRYRKSSNINVYELDGYPDYYFGYMLPSTSYVNLFEVLPYETGFILNLPERGEEESLRKFEPRVKLFETLKVSDEWSRMLGVDTVGDLNNAICRGTISDLMLVQEALQERRIGEIAKEIADRKEIKFVMIAGPSSSGKTSFSHRLSVQLMTYGVKPHPIALDNYFKNREDTPKDENGDYNFECLEAIDTELFNNDMTALLNGETVELPTFNFKVGKREYHGDRKKLGPDDILVLEGIHGLNDKMSYALPVNSKYKIYISALTTLNIDEHNRIPTTDGRLLRRIVRDARTRGASAKRTIQMWDSVRRGEEENIFPFQESADAFFNSASIFELAALKQFAEPLLYMIGEDEPEYYEAKRLLKLLEYFLGINTEDIPYNSIVREFVGGSIFPV